MQLDVLCIVAAKQQECTSTFLFQYFSIFLLVSKFCEKKLKIFWFWLAGAVPPNFGWGGEAPPDLPLTGLAGGWHPAFFHFPLTKRAPPGRPAGRPAERPAERLASQA